MRILSREFFKEGVILNAIFCCGLMFIGVITLQARPNDGLLQAKTVQTSEYDNEIPICKKQRSYYDRKKVTIKTLFFRFFFTPIVNSKTGIIRLKNCF